MISVVAAVSMILFMFVFLVIFYVWRQVERNKRISDVIKLKQKDLDKMSQFQNIHGPM